MFPDVPVLGLTATATSKVTVDVQKMLGIQGSIVFKATFNRPNLYYEVGTAVLPSRGYDNHARDGYQIFTNSPNQNLFAKRVF